MSWTLIEIRPGLVCRVYDDDHGNGASSECIEVSPIDYADLAVDVVSEAAYDDASSRAFHLALVERGGCWSGREFEPGEDNWNEYCFHFTDELLDDLPLPDPPMSRSYWITTRLLGGVYPGAATEEAAREKLQALLDDGVSLFIDLTEPGEMNHDGVALAPYEELLDQIESEKYGKPRRVSIPVPDMTAPSSEQVREALALIDEVIDRRGRVYVHCWGGRGRTGAVLGCWLAGQEDVEDGMARLNELRDPQIDDDRDREQIPQTAAQRALVRNWR